MLSELKSGDVFCWAWNRIYLKANGRIPCWCDKGEPHTIDSLSDSSDYAIDVVNGSRMREMRLTLLGLGQPYIKECSGCCCFSTYNKPQNPRYIDTILALDVREQAEQAFNYLKHVSLTKKWPLGSIDNISEIQVEPSLPCGLSCPGCVQRDKQQLYKVEPAPYMLKFDVFRKLLDDCFKHGININRIQYCGKGEPTLCRHLPEMIRYANKLGIFQSMDTNCNQEWIDDYLLLNRINCSIDGSTAESYSCYRRGGDFDKAIHFMSSAVNAKRSSSNISILIRWKYILFDTTEDPRLLDLAQKMAFDLGIDELDFVITSCGAFDHSVKPTIRFQKMSDMQDYINNNKIFNNVIVSRS